MQQLNTVKPEVRLIPCCHCDGTGRNDVLPMCYCGNTGKLDTSRGSCCTCGLVDCRCEV